MLKSLIEDNPQAKAIIERVTQLGETISDKRSEAVVAECAKQTEAHIAVPLRAEALTLRTSVNDTQQATQRLQTAAKRAVNKMTATRADAIIEYTCDVNRIGADIKSMSEITGQIEGVDLDVKTIMDDGSLDNLDKADKIYKYGGLKKQMTTIRNEIHDALVAHFNGIKDNFVDSYGKGSKRGLIDLVIPVNLKNGGGKELMENVNEYLTGRAEEYYGIIPMLRRVGVDIDPEEAVHWKPPSIDSGYGDYQAESRDIVKAQSKTFYIKLLSSMSPEMRGYITRTLLYGAEDKHSFKCQKFDGVSAFFVLMTQFRPQGTDRRDAIEKSFEDAAEHFAKDNPMGKIEHLRPKLIEAGEIGVKLRWSKTGKEIAVVMSRLDHDYSNALQGWKDGSKVSDPEDCALDLELMFADIETTLKQIQNGDRKLENNGQWRSHHVMARRPKGKGGSKGGKGGSKGGRGTCKYGGSCGREDCHFEHPHGWNPNNRRAAFGKGGRSKGGGKGGGKGSACEAEGCNREGKDGKKFCTPHYIEGMKQGELTKKDGSKHMFKRKRDSDGNNQGRNDVFGFEQLSNKQKQGFKQAMAVREKAIRNEITGDDDDMHDFAAPASVKRSVMERLGKLEDAAEPDSKRAHLAAFLEDINKC